VWSMTIEPSCSGCHDASSPAGGLNLSSESVAYSNLIADHVTAGDPDASSLYDRMTRTGSGRMPPSGTLSSDRISEVAEWITGGALP
jgi:mono/diheme cytochrome c family protein